MSRLWGTLALLSSSATLVCCVIPAVLVALGFGATLASTFSAFPQLTFLSEHKATLFTIVGILLAVIAAVRRRPETQTCPTDPALAAACSRAKSIGTILFRAAVLIYIGSLFFVFLLPNLLG